MSTLSLTYLVGHRRMRAEISEATAADVPLLLPLIAEHAAYERSVASCRPQDLVAALSAAPPRLWAWVARVDEVAVGYATATIDFATWTAKPFVYLDCLFVRAGHRSGGVGAALLGAVKSFARYRGIAQLQWQTPEWNERAIAFYLREGAIGEVKMRFVEAIE